MWDFMTACIKAGGAGRVLHVQAHLGLVLDVAEFVSWWATGELGRWVLIKR